MESVVAIGTNMIRLLNNAVFNSSYALHSSYCFPSVYSPLSSLAPLPMCRYIMWANIQDYKDTGKN